jgi:hypothetical protein
MPSSGDDVLEGSGRLFSPAGMVCRFGLCPPHRRR